MPVFFMMWPVCTQCNGNLIQSATTSTINIHRSSYNITYPKDWLFDWLNVRVVWCAMCAGFFLLFFFFLHRKPIWWLLCSRVDVLRALQEVNRDRKPFAQGTYFIRGKIKTSASIKSRFTRSSYSWALQQLNNCCRFKSFFFVFALLCFTFLLVWFDLVRFSSVRFPRNFHFLREPKWNEFVVMLLCVCVFVCAAQTNLDGRAKMCAKCTLRTPYILHRPITNARS